MSTWIGLEVECDDPRWEAVDQLSRDDDVPHITLAYLGKPTLTEFRQQKLVSTVTRWCVGSVYPEPYQVHVLGYDLFGGGSVTVLKVADVSSKRSLIHRQYQLVRDLVDNGFEVKQTYAFVPHVTVGHDFYFTPPFEVEGLTFNVKSLFVSYKGDMTHIDKNTAAGRCA